MPTRFIIQAISDDRKVPGHRLIYAVGPTSPLMFDITTQWFDENQPRPGDTVYWEKGSNEPLLIKKETNCDSRYEDPHC